MTPRSLPYSQELISMRHERDHWCAKATEWSEELEREAERRRDLMEELRQARASARAFQEAALLLQAEIDRLREPNP